MIRYKNKAGKEIISSNDYRPRQEKAKSPAITTNQLGPDRKLVKKEKRDENSK